LLNIAFHSFPPSPLPDLLGPLSRKIFPSFSSPVALLGFHPPSPFPLLLKSPLPRVASVCPALEVPLALFLCGSGLETRPMLPFSPDPPPFLLPFSSVKANVSFDSSAENQLLHLAPPPSSVRGPQDYICGLAETSAHTSLPSLPSLGPKISSCRKTWRARFFFSRFSIIAASRFFIPGGSDVLCQVSYFDAVSSRSLSSGPFMVFFA